MRKARSRLPKKGHSNVKVFIYGFLLGAYISLTTYLYFDNIHLRSLRSPSPINQCSETMCHELPDREQSGDLGEPDKLANLSDIELYIIKVFGEKDGFRAIEMLETCENKTLNPTAINHNNNGSIDSGLFQINSVHGYSQRELFDPEFNTDVAYRIYKRAGRSFRPWTCSTIIGEANYLGWR